MQDVQKTVKEEMEELEQINSVLDATEIVMDMEAYTNITDHDSLDPEDEIIVDGHVSLAQLEALVVLFKSKIN